MLNSDAPQTDIENLAYQARPGLSASDAVGW